MPPPSSPVRLAFLEEAGSGAFLEVKTTYVSDTQFLWIEGEENGSFEKTSILLALMFMVLAFTPTANAQQPLGVSSCSATPVVPLVRAEGVAEAAGDIDILCTNTPGLA